MSSTEGRWKEQLISIPGSQTLGGARGLAGITKLEELLCVPYTVCSWGKE